MSPKVSGPVKLPSHLHQKTNSSGIQFCADLCSPPPGESFSVYKSCLGKKGKILIIILAEKCGVMPPPRSYAYGCVRRIILLSKERELSIVLRNVYFSELCAVKASAQCCVS